MPLHLLHPAAVHFPIALLSAGFAAACLERWGKRPAWLAQAASWLLWLGTISAWGALGLGLLAEKMAPHVPAAWEAMEEHEELAWWTVGLFTALSLWRYRFPGGLPVIAKRWQPLAYLGLWALAWGVLLAAAFHGGELVFAYGVGLRKP